MRTIVASADAKVGSWLQGVLGSAGVSVVVLQEASPDAPELPGGDLLIVDSESAALLGDNGPRRRMLLVPRGRSVDVTEALSSGYMDLLVVPAPEDEVLARVGRALDHLLKPVRLSTDEIRTQTAELRSIVDRVVEAQRVAAPEIRAGAEELAKGMLSLFLMLTDSHESTERGAAGHSRRVGSLARRMAMRAGMGAESAEWMHLAGRLQDIGLLPLRLPLAQEAPLSRELRRALVDHATLSAEILAPLEEWGLPVEAVRRHHERVDGSGYPDRLEAAELAFDAQILGAADVFEALTAPRPWRPASTRDEALEAMRAMRAFSAKVLGLVEACTKVAVAAGSA